MKMFSRLAALSIIVLCCVGCDQITKMWAKSILQAHSSLSFFGNLFHFVYAENTGTMLGMGSGLSEEMRFVLFVLVVGMVLVAATAFVLIKPLHTVTVLAISLVVGGGTSNLIDRLIHNGSVIDFMLIKIGSLETGIFNVADLGITLGACMLFLSYLSSRDKKYSHESR